LRITCASSSGKETSRRHDTKDELLNLDLFDINTYYSFFAALGVCILRRIKALLKQEILEVQHANETMNLLQPTAYFLASLYFLLTLAHFFLLLETFKWLLITTALLTSIVCLTIGLKTTKVPFQRHSLLILVMILMASSNSLLHLWFSGDSEQTTNIFVTIIASGIVFSHRAHWAILVIFNWIGWIAINIILDMALTQHFFFAMAMNTLLSWFAHLARIKLVEKQLALEQERDIAIQHEQVAKAATEAKSTFLANMSHEIRTPINGIIGMIELVSHSKLDDKQTDYIATAKRSAGALMVIINDVLDFSKIEAGELTIELIEFDLEQLFTDFTHDMQFQADKKKLEIKLLKRNILQKKVVGDPHRITQVLNNLLSNAIKFTQSGSIVFEYSLIMIDGHLRLNVEVTDTGIGISEKALLHIFDSFSQADMSTTRNFGGTGLGLAITRQLCELMGGCITARSKLGEGSTFHFSVMLGMPEPAIKRQQEFNSHRSLTHLKDLRVLLVEDNLINQEVMFAILRNLGVAVDIANDGIEALTMLVDSPSTTFDLILMDCQMPNLDGYETTRRIRAGDAGDTFSDVPIAALTANTMNNEQQKCIAAGMNEYLTKPIDTHTLELLLTKYRRIKLALSY
jgi:signal transduction histidine kinase/ActR/RegA family two-component response regulator